MRATVRSSFLIGASCSQRPIVSLMTRRLLFAAVLINSVGTCSAQQAKVTVPGVAQIALAGALPGTSTPNGDSTPLDSPVQVNLPITAGQAIQISATGLVGYNGATPNILPNGSNNTDGTETGTGLGIGKIYGPRAALIGVFTSDNLDLRNIPPFVDYTGDAANIPLVTPMLQQPFLVGSGVTASGMAKTWIVPGQATRLYLAVLGYYMRANTGSFTANVNLVAPPDISTNPIRVSGVAQIALAGALPGTSTPNGDTAPLQSPAPVQVPLIPGQALRFTGSGTVGYNGASPRISPDGSTDGDSTETGTGLGIGKIAGPRAALIGVFTGNTLDLRNVPPSVDYTSGAARDRSNFTPLLQQPFFIGTGMISTGDFRRVIVPVGATRLYLGVLGYYMRANTGSYTVVASPDTPTTPQLPQTGAVSSIGFGAPPIGIGSIISIFGSSLSDQTLAANTLPLSTVLGNTQVFFNTTAAPLLLVSPGQINVQVPFELSVDKVQVVINHAGLASLPLTLGLVPYRPDIFTVDGRTSLVWEAASGMLVNDLQPAATGDALSFYATGLGPLSPALPSGAPGPGDYSAVVPVKVSVTLGKTQVAPDYAGAAPGFVGVYQINFAVPSNVQSGPNTLQLTIGGVSSNSVVLAIQ